MSECHFQRHLNKFTGTGAQQLVHKPNISASKSVESFLVTFPASVKHSIKLSPVMYRTRSPQKGKQEGSSGAMEGSLDQALQAIREQLGMLANERRTMEIRVDTLTTGARAACVQFAARRSVVTVQRTVVTDNFRAVPKTPVKGVDEVDYAPKEADYNQDRSSVSSAGSSHESLLTRNSPDIMKTSNASPNNVSSEVALKTRGTPTYSCHVTTPTLRHSPVKLQTPSRPSSIVSDSSFNLPFASQLSIDKPDDGDERNDYYSSSLVLNDSISPAYCGSDARLRVHSDSKRSSGSTTIVRRSSETGQLEHVRKPNRNSKSFSNTNVAAVQLRHNHSPSHEKPKHLKGSRTSVILPSIETTV